MRDFAESMMGLSLQTSAAEQLKPISLILEYEIKIIENLYLSLSYRYLSGSGGYSETSECSPEVIRAICVSGSGATGLSIVVRCSGGRGVAIHVQHKHPIPRCLMPIGRI